MGVSGLKRLQGFVDTKEMRGQSHHLSTWGYNAATSAERLTSQICLQHFGACICWCLRSSEGLDLHNEPCLLLCKSSFTFNSSYNSFHSSMVRWSL